MGILSRPEARMAQQRKGNSAKTFGNSDYRSFYGRAVGSESRFRYRRNPPIPDTKHQFVSTLDGKETSPPQPIDDLGELEQYMSESRIIESWLINIILVGQTPLRDRDSHSFPPWQLTFSLYRQMSSQAVERVFSGAKIAVRKVYGNIW